MKRCTTRQRHRRTHRSRHVDPEDVNSRRGRLCVDNDHPTSPARRSSPASSPPDVELDPEGRRSGQEWKRRLPIPAGRRRLGDPARSSTRGVVASRDCGWITLSSVPVPVPSNSQAFGRERFGERVLLVVAVAE